jgi:hypothetical protein
MAKTSASPKEIVLTGVVVRAASVHNADQRHARVEFTAAWDREIREEMGWDEVPENFGAADLFGTLAISKAVLTPTAPVAKNGDMPQHMEEFPATELTSFSAIPVKDKGGETVGHELRFTLKSQFLGTAGRVGRYVGKIGRGPATLCVTIAEQDAQQSLDTGG